MGVQKGEIRNRAGTKQRGSKIQQNLRLREPALSLVEGESEGENPDLLILPVPGVGNDVLQEQRLPLKGRSGCELLLLLPQNRETGRKGFGLTQEGVKKKGKKASRIEKLNMNLG